MGPFIKDNNTTKKMMNHLLIALTPIILFAFIKNGLVYYHIKKDIQTYLECSIQ